VKSAIFGLLDDFGILPLFLLAFIKPKTSPPRAGRAAHGQLYQRNKKTPWTGVYKVFTV
jgi:hypothetical protein